MPGCLGVADVGGVGIAELAGACLTPAPHGGVVEHGARVEAAGRDGHGRAPGPEVDRTDRARCLVVADVRGVAVAELAVGADAPATDGGVVEQGAGVLAGRGDGDGRSSRPQVHRTDRARCLVIADVAGVRVAEAALGAGSPAAHGRVVEQGTRMIEARREGHGRPPGSEIDRRDRARVLVVADVGGVPVAEPAVGAEPPAAHGGVVMDGAAELGAGGDRAWTRRQGAEADRTDRARRLVVADVVGVRVAELAKSAGPPAANGGVIEQSARVGAAGRDGHGRPPGPQVHRTDRPRCLVVADVVGVDIAEPPAEAESPAAHGRVVEQRARMGSAGRDRHGRPPGPQVHRTDRPRRLVIADLVCVAVAEHAAGAVPPAAHGGVVEQRACVVGTRRDCYGRPPGPEIDRTDRSRRLVVADGGGVGVAEAAIATSAPATHIGVVEHCAGVEDAGSDGHGRPPGPQVHRTDRPRCLVVADVGGVGVAELAEAAVPPAANGGVVEQRARMRSAGRDRHGRPPGPKVHRTDRPRCLGVADVGGVGVAERAVATESPAAYGGVVEQRARVIGAGRDSHGRPSRPQVDRTDRPRRLVVADGGEVGVAEPAVGAVSPAAHGAVVADRTGVRVARIDPSRLDGQHLRGRLLGITLRDDGKQ